MAELKPCPVCGGEAEIVDNDWFVDVSCKDFHCRGWAERLGILSKTKITGGQAVRLIDANNAKKDFNLYFGGVYDAVIANRILDEQPTIDPEELRPKGRWIVHGNSCECSNCNTLGSPQWKCCPVCEAKMEDV